MQALVCADDSPPRPAVQTVPELAPLPHEALMAVWAVSLNRGELRNLETAQPGWRPGWDLAGDVLARAAGTSPIPRRIDWSNRQGGRDTQAPSRHRCPAIVPVVRHDIMSLVRYTWIITVTIAVGCGPGKDNTTSSASEDSLATDASISTTAVTSMTSLASTSTFGTMSSGPTTGQTTDTTGISADTSTEVSTGAVGTSGGSTGGETDGAPLDIDFPGGCMKVCEKIIVECMIPDVGAVPECTNTCVTDAGFGTVDCNEATQIYLDCLAELDCVALENAVINGNFGTCKDESLALC